MRAATALSAVLVFLSIAVHAADGSGGTRAGNALLRGEVGARPSALGGAYTALAEGPLALRYNPAGLAERAGWRTGRSALPSRGRDGDRGATRAYGLFAQFDASFADINRSDLIFARPLWHGGFGIGISYIDYGALIRTTTVNKTNAGSFGAHDLLVRLGYGRAVSEQVAFGASLGVYDMTIDAYRATGVFGDLGALYRPGPEGLMLGAGIRNIGQRARFVGGGEDLPLAVTLGAAWQATPIFLGSIDWEMVPSAEGALRAGLEVTPIDLMALRIGYDGRNDAGSGLTTGLGFRIADLQLDYAYVPFGELGDAHRVSAEWAFGPSMEEAPPTAPIRPIASTPQRVEPARPAAAARPIAPPRTAAAAVAEGEAAADAGFDQRAERLFREAIQLDPDHVVALYNVATYRYLANDFGEAARLFDAVVRRAPRDHESWLYLGLSQSKLGRTSEARAAFARVIAIDPGNAYARRMMGM